MNLKDPLDPVSTILGFLLSLMMPKVITSAKKQCEITFFCNSNSYLSRAFEDPNFGFVNLNYIKIFLLSLAEKG